MQRSPSIIILRIYIRTFVQFRLDASKIAIPRSRAGFKRQVELLEAEGIEVYDGQLDMDKYRWDPTLDELVWGPGMLHDPRQQG